MKIKFTIDKKTLSMFYKRKRVLKNDEIKRIVEEAYVKSKLAGHKKIQRGAASYTELSNLKILELTKSDIKYKEFPVRFTNKAKPHPVRAKSVHDCHHIDLADMKKTKLDVKAKFINIFFYYWIFLLNYNGWI